MTWVLVGLGNPGEEYSHTRHNAGRIALEHFVTAEKLGDLKFESKSNALFVRGDVNGAAVSCVFPQTYMNKSGSAVVKYVKSLKAAEKCVVLYDDLDLPIGSVKMSFNRGSGGHKGIESIARALKTKAFWRIRIGVSPVTAGGKLKKPSGEKDVLEFILGTFKPSEREALKKVLKRTTAALQITIAEGGIQAMNECNTV